MRQQNKKGVGVTYFCERCASLCADGEKCNSCGYNKLRAVKAEDFCYLTTVSEGFGNSVMQCLENENIPCFAVPVGNGVRSCFALSLGNYKLYVAYKQLDEAKRVIEFFTENYSTDKLKEFILSNISKWHFDGEKTEKKIRRKLKLDNCDDVLAHIRKVVEEAQSVEDVGLMHDNEHGLLVKSGGVLLWFSSESFKINV